MMQTNCAPPPHQKTRSMARAVTQSYTRLHTCANDFYKLVLSQVAVCKSPATWAVCTLLVLLTITPVARAADDPLEQKALEIAKAGQPIEPEHFELPHIPDNENAAVDLIKAGKSVNTKTPAWTAYDFLDEIAAPITDAEAATFHDLSAENTAAFALIDQAMTRKSIDWKIKMTSPVFQVLLPHLNDQRMLANLLQAHALLRQHENADADALADVHRLFFISRSVDRQGFVVAHLVSLGIMSLAANTIDMMAPNLKIGPAPAASPALVKQRIADLLDDGPSRAGEKNALLMERMADLDAVRSILSGKITPEQLAKLGGSRQKSIAITPQTASADGILMLTYLTNVINAFDSTTDWPTFKSRRPARPGELDTDPNQHVLGNMIIPTVDRALLTHYRCVTDRHLAALVLAIRAYTVTHDNKPPQRLTDLVPEYFPTVPTDPMAPGQPLKYIAGKSIVYSVGDDAKDDGGSEKSTGRGHGRWQTQDAVVHLDPQPRK